MRGKEMSTDRMLVQIQIPMTSHKVWIESLEWVSDHFLTPLCDVFPLKLLKRILLIFFMHI